MPFQVLTVDYQTPDASKQFVDSLRHTGFAVIKNHPIPFHLIDECYQDWQKFFASEEKMQHLYDKTTHTGYFPFRSENAKGYSIKNLMEYYHYRQWKGVPEGMQNITHVFYEAMENLAITLLSWVQKHLPENIRAALEMPLQEMIAHSKRTVLRIIHYPPLTGNEEPGAFRAAPHEDINLITLLPAATTSGLQVKDQQDHWHDVSCDHGTITINTGDTLRALTQDFLPATTHRVNNPTGELAKKSRLSMPMFVHPYAEIKLPNGMTAYEYWAQRMKENGVY